MNTSSRSLFTLFIFLGLSVGLSAQSVKDALFLIQEDGKFGYINQSGKVKIPPTYKEAGPFADGLAPVRIGGCFGFIDGQNKVEIPAVFDYAQPFSEGYALVYRGGKPLFINRQGEQIIDVNEIFAELLPFPKDTLPNFSMPIVCQSFKDGRTPIWFNKKAVALLKKDGTLWADQIFSDIRLPFLDGLVVVQREKEWGILNTEGNVVVPFGKYQQIERQEEGYTTVSVKDNKSQTIHYFDKSAREIAVIPAADSLIFHRTFPSDGMIAGKLYQKIGLKVAKNGTQSYRTQAIPIYYDIKRQKIIRNELATEMTKPFQNGHTLVGTKDGHRIMNKNGDFIGATAYPYVHPKLGFYDGVAFVQINGGYRLINTKGEFVSDNSWSMSGENGFKDAVAYVGFTEKIQNKFISKWGTINTKGEWVTSPIEHGYLEDFEKMEDWYVKIDRQFIHSFNPKTGEFWQKYTDAVDPNGFQNGLIRIIEKQQIAYLNKKGDYVWQPTRRPMTSLKLDTFDISYQKTAIIYGRSSGKNHYGRDNSKSPHVAKKITRQLQLPKNQLSVTLKKSAKSDTLRGNYATQRYYIANLTQDTLRFSTQDTRLYARLQALNAAGEWRDIEDLPSSWCGNSYYPAQLNPDEYWTGLIPVYKGDFKTQLRLAVFGWSTLKKPYKMEAPVYSAPFEGSINPAQFWRKESYSSTGMRDAIFDYGVRDF